jgi:hypothetical protein
LFPQNPQLLLSVWVQTLWPLHICGLAHPPDDEEAEVVLELEAPVVLLEEAPVVLLEEAPVVLLEDDVVVVELEDVVEPPLAPPPDVELDVLELDELAPPFATDPPNPIMPPAPPLPLDEEPVFAPPVPVDVAWVPPPPLAPQPTSAKEASTAVEETGFIHLFRTVRIIGMAS